MDMTAARQQPGKEWKQKFRRGGLEVQQSDGQLVTGKSRQQVALLKSYAFYQPSLGLHFDTKASTQLSRRRCKSELMLHFGELERNSLIPFCLKIGLAKFGSVYQIVSMVSVGRLKRLWTRQNFINGLGSSWERGQAYEERVENKKQF